LGIIKANTTAAQGLCCGQSYELRICNHDVQRWRATIATSAVVCEARVLDRIKTLAKLAAMVMIANRQVIDGMDQTRIFTAHALSAWLCGRNRNFD